MTWKQRVRASHRIPLLYFVLLLWLASSLNQSITLGASSRIKKKCSQPRHSLPEVGISSPD